MWAITKRVVPLCAVSLSLLLVGCGSERYGLTHSLWTHVDLRRFSMPAVEPHVAIYCDPNQNDFLVLYDELDEKADAIRRRAYYLNGNVERIWRNERPKFVDIVRAQSLPAVPIIDSPVPPANNAGGPSLCACQPDNKRVFVMIESGAAVSTNELPAYVVRSGTAVKIAITPFAIAGDATIIGFILGSSSDAVNVSPDPTVDVAQLYMREAWRNQSRHTPVPPTPPPPRR